MPRPKFNIWLLWSIRVLAVIFVIWSIKFGSKFYSIADTASLVHSIAGFGYSFSLSILGFLIAGFAIFATLTKPDLFIILAQIPYKKNGQDTGISRLQFIFFNFLNVFTVILFLLSVSAFISVGFSDHSPLHFISGFLSDYFLDWFIPINSFVYSFMAVVLVDALLKLKSFIWNLYQSVILTITTEAELKNNSTTTK